MEPSAVSASVSTLAASLDSGQLRRFRAALDAADYTRDRVRAALESDEHLTAQPGEVIVFEHRLTGKTPLEILLRLFLIGSTVPAADLETSLPAIPPAELQKMGLIELTDAGARSTVRIIPHGDIVIACDRNYYGDRDSHDADVVTGVTNPAILLADLTIRKRVRTALDLGTGGGIQALLLSNHCERVVAVDVNPRALEYARLNASLNGVENLELRLGSWFEPVADERFDIITANPPYVISPDSSFLYRDSGMPADSLCRQLITAAPGFLAEGGFAHMLISWALRGGEEWPEPLRRWVEGMQCDAWLLHYHTEDPLTHAAKWNQRSSSVDLPRYADALDRWTDYYRREGIQQIAFGAVILRRRSGGSNWVRADSFHAGRGSSAGLVLRVFEAEDFLCDLTDDGKLLGERFALAPEHRLEQRLASSGGVWHLQEATLTLTQGIAFQGSLDIHSAELLQRLDGRRTLKQTVAKLSRDLELSTGDAAALTEAAVAMIKRLYQLGFLERTAA